MIMNTQTIDLLYNEIIKLPNGVERIKIDLHVHTPSSTDTLFWYIIYAFKYTLVAMLVNSNMV